ncbi:unnamed protein product [Rangifer tarandus platyrhynchus]|uniref:Uncharacterized protein n=2 Tax=Rangifer tarandus platyrhynchus TaxID=3082113 RepID=A0ABN9A5C7_RANTA|nr:unnamed protein product [Rangifer tarandus platyrhynchus]
MLPLTTPTPQLAMGVTSVQPLGPRGLRSYFVTIVTTSSLSSPSGHRPRPDFCVPRTPSSAEGNRQHLQGTVDLSEGRLSDQQKFQGWISFCFSMLIILSASLCWSCSVTKSFLTLCAPMDCSTPGFPVLHHLPELAQTHVHRVSDAIQPSPPLSSPSPPACNLSQHQGLSERVSSSHQVVRV